MHRRKTFCADREHARSDGWCIHEGPDRLPEQGWKIHLSTRPADAAAVLTAFARIALVRGWTWKHLPSLDDVEFSNDKDAPRTSSGKFITVYPTDDHEFELATRLLRERFRSTPGPRILGDLQFDDGIVHARYGGFVEMRTDAGDLAILTPAGHREVDQRRSVFTPPDWVDLPPSVMTEWQRVRDAPPGPLSTYRVTGAFSISNAGGVYRAEDRTGRSIVLKEGREHVALDAGGRDAARRVSDEFSVLSGLPTGVGPTPVETFSAGGSTFAAITQIAGDPFNRAVMSQNPMTSGRPTVGRRTEYTRRVSTAIESTARTLARLHAAGYTHNDLAPRNVLLDREGTAVLVDLESVASVGDSTPNGPSTPGFSAPSRISGTGRDAFSLKCLELAAYVPLTELMHLDPTKLLELGARGEDLFPESGAMDTARTLYSAVVPDEASQPTCEPVDLTTATIVGGRGSEDVTELLTRDTCRAAFATALAAEELGDRVLLRRAERCLEAELARCERVPDGSLQVRDGARWLPSLSGLLTGRAGLIVALADALALAHPSIGALDVEAELLEQIDLLGIHAVRTPAGVRFPGQRLDRFDESFAHGSIGVAWAIRTARQALDGCRRPVVPPTSKDHER